MKNPEEQTVSTNTLQSLKEGDRHAYKDICRHYEAKVRCYVFSFVKSEKVTEEIVGKICTEIWNHKQQIRIGAFDAFLLSLCKDLIYETLYNAFNKTTAKEELWRTIHRSDE
ncbi:hypothetical protein LS482_19440 [Sinomicrobium kalidii]|uniref:hypothetical protein n=1 Tax=Sinomicrobium kalidii TaxID=2900738 RepID=UPI001E64587E|nr:hypothetical protein [Sinomicrobium kalidii]UGU15840.1 hypothetical protein LS482_19440 [Sinomicrobium kalidii]